MTAALDGDPSTVHYVCVNGCIVEEVDKPEVGARGEWRATAPFNGRAAFHIWTAYSQLKRGLGEPRGRVAPDHARPREHNTFINTAR